MSIFFYMLDQVPVYPNVVKIKLIISHEQKTKTNPSSPFMTDIHIENKLEFA